MARKKEIWIPIRGWEEKYEVSNLSRVRSIKTGDVLKPITSGNKYYYFMFYDPTLKKKCKRVKVYLHRAVAWHFVPNPYHYNEVNHKDGNKYNCDISNLEWCSKSQNSKHAVAIGLHRPKFMDGSSRGEGNANSKLNWEKVDKIREEWVHIPLGKKRQFCRDKGKEYGVNANTIHQVVLNNSWKEENRIKHIEDEGL